MKELNRKIGDMEYDGLITDLNPPVEVRGRVIAKQSSEKTFLRGTIFARSKADSKLYILGSTPDTGDTLTPDCILCDDSEIGTVNDLDTPVYTAGCFHPGKVTVADGYTISDADLDELRKRNIVFRMPHAAN